MPESSEPNQATNRPREKPTIVHTHARIHELKMTNFEVGIFHSFLSLGISACRKTPLGIFFKNK